MRSFCKLILLLAFSFTANAENLGVEVKPKLESTGPDFQILFDLASPPVWLATVGIPAYGLAPNSIIHQLFWRLYDSEQGAYITDWQIGIHKPNGATYSVVGLNLSTTEDAETVATIKSMKSIKLVLSVDSETKAPTHFVDLGVFCSTHPYRVTNVTTMKDGCEIDN